LKELKCFTNKISYSISTGRLREKFDIHDDNKDGKLGIEGFTSLTHDILHDQQVSEKIAKLCFMLYYNVSAYVTSFLRYSQTVSGSTR
jgi:Ca2+-binding EF-hand superfamily protein